MKLWRHGDRTFVLDTIQEVGISDDHWSGYSVYIRQMASKEVENIAHFYCENEENAAYRIAQTYEGFKAAMEAGKWQHAGLEYRAKEWLKAEGVWDEIAAKCADEDAKAYLDAQALRDQIEFLLGEVDIYHVSVEELPT